MTNRDEILAELARAVDEMDEEAAVRAARRAVAEGVDAYEAITHGSPQGMERVSEKYESGVYFVPEILLCADAMYAAIDVLKPHLARDGGRARSPVIIGVIEGDIHDIGKNIVKLMLDAAGFPVHDLGRDVPVERSSRRRASWQRHHRRLHAHVHHHARHAAAGAGAGEAGLRRSFKMMIGGGPVSAAFAQDRRRRLRQNAMDAVRIANAWEEAGQCATA